MSDLVAFNEAQTKRIINTVRKVEGAPHQDTPSRNEQPPIIQLVEITGEIDGETGLYPGDVITYTDTGASRTKNVLGECRVHFPVSTVRLKDGNVILCRFSGPIDGGALGLFVPAYPVKIVEVVTDVECMDNELVVSYEEIVVFDFDIPA